MRRKVRTGGKEQEEIEMKQDKLKKLEEKNAIRREKLELKKEELWENR